MTNYTAIYVEKKTGKQLWKLTSKPLPRYLWEKEKLRVFEWLIRERWLDRKEVEVQDLSFNGKIPVGEL